MFGRGTGILMIVPWSLTLAAFLLDAPTSAIATLGPLTYERIKQ
ncbi:Uncharacterized protein APZ42_009212 [Daphnia magna]|uniref:Uncharacterized protein n=1 Tax=Daphnia magna TaxID=35525 RepID=A0A164E5C1_9CRUS|nr:Uncharacterized protein APZ42_009212 [Daphnia magna]